MPYQDGTFTSAVQNGPKQIFYPFLNSPTKDTTTKGTIRNYVVIPNSYTPAAALSTDPDDANQYLILETEPTIEAGIARFQRTYCKVPSDQVIYGTRVITKPSPSSQPGGTGYIYGVYDSSALTTSSTASRYSNALFSNNGNVFYPLTTTTSANSGSNTRVTWTSHGLGGTETIAVLNGTYYVKFASGTYSVINSSTIDLLGVNYGSNAVTAAKYIREYTTGTDRVRIKSTQKFYLPTVTSGITTPQDIPIPTLLLNDTELLASVIANTTGYQTYDASELQQWNGGPIYTQTLQEIDMTTL